MGTLKIGHIVEVEIKDINLGHTHTQLGTIIDPEIDLEMDHTIDPGKDSEMNHITDQETNIEMDHTIDPETHRKDMKIHMDKGINHKKETLHILGKEIIAKIETTEKETHHSQEATAITDLNLSLPMKSNKGSPSSKS